MKLLLLRLFDDKINTYSERVILLSKFFAFIYRMKYISRWSLMRNTRTENVAEHSYHVSVLAHALAVISRDVFDRDIDPGRVAAAALYHDMPEILTGDLPTPIKYYGSDIKAAYKRIEKEASEKLLGNLTPEMKKGISDAAMDEDERVNFFVKAADKLDAYIKCLEEIGAGNRDFVTAEKQTKKALDEMQSDEVKYFIENYLDAFSMTVDEL
ncbi:MAG: 5'-deoxynucleotidase [Oscillospiraceae bacterium]|nr:5'-deoxynucleotidase [Oscillospiraceae bacterium]